MKNLGNFLFQRGCLQTVGYKCTSFPIDDAILHPFMSYLYTSANKNQTLQPLSMNGFNVNTDTFSKKDLKTIKLDSFGLKIFDK